MFHAHLCRGEVCGHVVIRRRPATLGVGSFGGFSRSVAGHRSLPRGGALMQVHIEGAPRLWVDTGLPARWQRRPGRQWRVARCDFGFDDADLAGGGDFAFVITSRFGVTPAAGARAFDFGLPGDLT